MLLAFPAAIRMRSRFRKLFLGRCWLKWSGVEVAASIGFQSVSSLKALVNSFASVSVALCSLLAVKCCCEVIGKQAATIIEIREK